MYVVLENYLGMVCDYPAAYEGQPGFEFIRAVPTIWDETKVIDANIGEYITTARRKGDDWYIGSITGHEERSLNINFAFLPEGEYVVDVYTDGKNAIKEPKELIHQIRTVTKNDTMTIWLAGGGGAVMHVRKK
jgi:alpha-glucosidase